MKKQVEGYTKPESLKDVAMHYCAGCGHSIVHKLIAEIIDELDIRERTIAIAPVGCAVLAYNYIDVDFAEAAHGRVPAVATGIKRTLPDRVVLAYQGDGDLAAIGMAETIHAANRGEHITVIFINNTVYGMTGGQMAPTTLIGQTTTTSPKGRVPDSMGYPIKVCELLATLNAPYYIERVAIDGPQGVIKTKKAILTAFLNQIENKGYSFVEVLSPCPTYFRLSPVQSLQYVKEKMIPYFPTRRFKYEGKLVNE
jgi:2-oxoglutarate ferredoxin oxidoreductase subunit beta